MKLSVLYLVFFYPLATFLAYFNASSLWHSSVVSRFIATLKLKQPQNCQTLSQILTKDCLKRDFSTSPSQIITVYYSVTHLPNATYCLGYYKDGGTNKISTTLKKISSQKNIVQEMHLLLQRRLITVTYCLNLQFFLSSIIFAAVIKKQRFLHLPIYQSLLSQMG